MNLIDFASQHPLKVRRDPADGTNIIPGRKGNSHLFEYGGDLLGVLIMAETGKSHWWTHARAAFIAAGMTITQNADQRGCHLRSTNKEQVRAALKYAGVRRRRGMSALRAAALTRAREMATLYRRHFRQLETSITPAVTSNP